MEQKDQVTVCNRFLLFGAEAIYLCGGLPGGYPGSSVTDLLTLPVAKIIRWHLDQQHGVLTHLQGFSECEHTPKFDPFLWIGGRIYGVQGTCL